MTAIPPPGPDRAADSPPQLVPSLLRRIRPHAALLALGLMSSAASLAQPLVAQWVIDTAGTLGTEQTGMLGSVPRRLLPPALALAGLVIGSAALVAVQRFILERAAEDVVLHARRDLSERMLRVRLDVLGRTAPGDLLSRMTADTTLLRDVSTTVIVDLITGAVTLLAAIALMAAIDVTLLVAAVAALFATALVVGALLPRIRRAAAHGRAAVGLVSATLERALTAVRTVRASGAVGREAAAVTAAACQARDRGVAAARYTAAAAAVTGLAMQLAFLTILVLGGARVAAGTLSVAQLIAFLLYLFYLSEPVGALTSGVSTLQEGLAAVQRLDELAALPSEDHTAATGNDRVVVPVRRRSPPIDVGERIVAFDRVGFAHDVDAEPTLRDVSFTIGRTGLTAIVGPSGAGKTTLFGLLERFYDPDAGRILLDGIDVRRQTRSQVRQRLALVEQDAPVLAGTLDENLRYGAPARRDADLYRVARDVGLGCLVDRLPHGLATPVGPHGVTLSGGQRQRIAVARALLRQPAVLLLDEATAQLDGLSEQALRAVIDRAARNRAVLAIAHRLSTVAHADQIVVLDGGQVRARGTHRQLLADDVLYRRLVGSQRLAAA